MHIVWRHPTPPFVRIAQCARYYTRTWPHKCNKHVLPLAQPRVLRVPPQRKTARMPMRYRIRDIPQHGNSASILIREMAIEREKATIFSGTTNMLFCIWKTYLLFRWRSVQYVYSTTNYYTLLAIIAIIKWTTCEGSARCWTQKKGDEIGRQRRRYEHERELGINDFCCKSN